MSFFLKIYGEGPPKKENMSESEKQVYDTTKDAIACFGPCQCIARYDVIFDSI
jgi:hypothetical protein